MGQPTSPLKLAIQKRIASFIYAFQGWGYALRSQPNTWIHALATVLVIAIGLWVGLPLDHWAILVLAIGAVWMGEFFNTAIEATIDLTSPDPHPLAKAGKDVSAGAVLIMAICAGIVGFLIMGPPLWAKLTVLFF